MSVTYLPTGEDVHDATDWFTQHFPPNGGYYPADGLIYQPCYRCGINMELTEWDGHDKRGRKFCRDCNYPSFIRVFETEAA